MRLYWGSRIITTLLTVLSLDITSSFVAADAAFLDVRTSLSRDRSGRRGDPKDKYFHESTFDPHYDGRFGDHEVDKSERLPHLRALMQTFLSTMSDIGAETWIMHGTLLGWWWNQRILPWDSDIDVQVTESTIAFLAKYYNMTEYHYLLPGVPKGRTYLLEINPHYVIRDQADRLNVIDARWIDTSNGLFIDISTIRPDRKKREQGVQDALMVKDRHHYLERDIFPLRDSFFEGIHVKIPYEYSSLLAEEYGPKSLTQTEFKHHRFNETSKVWEPLPGKPPPENKRPSNGPPRRINQRPGTRPP